jgi:hypothetical protein
LTVVAWVNYAQFLDAAGTPTGYRFQDYAMNETRLFEGNSYASMPFEVAVGGGASGGDRSSAALSTFANDIAVNVITEACDNEWLLEVAQVKIDRVTGDNLMLFTREPWLCNSYSYSQGDNIITLSLGSLLNAVDGLVGRTLTSKMVGRLPVSGGLRLG